VAKAKGAKEMRNAMSKLRKAMTMGLVGGASMLALPGGCGAAGELLQMGWNIGEQLSAMTDESGGMSDDESYDDSFFYGF
jgi:hypothetical protein